MKNQRKFIARLVAASIVASAASGAAFACDDQASATPDQRAARGATIPGQPAPDVIPIQHVARGGVVAAPAEDVVLNAAASDTDPAVTPPVPPVRVPRGG